MIYVTGKTWEFKDRLRIWGGEWNTDKRRWEFHTLSEEHRKILSKPGISISKSVEALALPARRPSTKKTKFIGDDPSWIDHFADKNVTTYFGFSSLNAMIKYIKALQLRDRNGTGWGEENQDFYGTENMTEALKLATDGWPEGVKMAQDVIEQLVGINAIERRLKYSVAGGSVNVGRMLAGNPAHMRSRPKLAGSKVVTLFVSATMMGVIDAENAIIRAAVVAAVTDVLESNGYSCEIIVIDSYRAGSKPAGQCAVKLKDAGEPFNINDAVFALGHPSFLRRLCFAIVGSDQDMRYIWSQGMGCDGVLFNEEHRPAKNELYIDHLNVSTQRAIDKDKPLLDQALQIWALIADKSLPINIKGE